MLGAKTCRFGFGATALLCAVLCGGVLSAQTPQYRVEGPKSYYRYFIYPGDVLRISVSQHSELSKTVVVMPNGENQSAVAQGCESCGLVSSGCN